MPGWRDRRLLDLFGIPTPILLAPMAGSGGPALAIGAMEGGALGSLPCATTSPERIREDVAAVRAAAPGPVNLNFFCHTLPDREAIDETAWKAALAPYYAEYRVGPPAERPAARRPFDAALCAVVEEIRPEIVSFHFGLPEESLLARVRTTGARILSTAASIAEARWLDAQGVDAIIAQGWEAGGHSGRFLPADPASYMGTMALVPQVVDAVSVPVIAAGGIADARGIAAALMLGASAAQIGTAYLACPESLIPPLHRARLTSEEAERTIHTNVFTGRYARALPSRLVVEQGPIHPAVPPFPHGGDVLVELRRVDPAGFANMWAGQAARLSRPESARALTERLAREALVLLDG